MTLSLHIARIAARLRNLWKPRYHPERHYMRGPGPACARRRPNDPAAA
jgi:hypothetical protein